MKNSKHNLLKIIALSFALALFSPGVANADFPTSPHYGHWVFMGGDITSTVTLIKNNPDFIGIKKVYHWKYLETSEGVYDFSEITSDLAELQAEGKRLWVQVSTTTWSSGGSPRTPEYMWTDSKYGGTLPYYSVYERSVGYGGWVPIFWNTELQDRFRALNTALGASFNGEAYFEGVTLGETSIGRPPGAQFGYTVAGALAGFKTIASAMKTAFPDKAFIHNVNYAPFDRADFCAWCVSNNIGIGCPDFRINSVTNSIYTLIYPIMLQYHDDIPIAPDVQWEDYEYVNPETGVYGTAAELLIASHDITDPHYFSWERREPYFTNDVIPAVNEYPTLPITRIASGPGVVDNGDAGTSSTGSWYVSSGPSPYGSGSLYCQGGIYTYEKVLSGNYEVSLWWTSLSRRPSSAIIRIYNNVNLIDTVVVNQKINGGQWNLLGTYDFTGTAKIEVLSAGSSDRTNADAVKFSSGESEKPLSPTNVRMKIIP